MNNKQKVNLGHHGQNEYSLQDFRRDAKLLIDTTEDVCNPFCDNSNDLLILYKETLPIRLSLALLGSWKS